MSRIATCHGLHGAGAPVVHQLRPLHGGGVQGVIVAAQDHAAACAHTGARGQAVPAHRVCDDGTRTLCRQAHGEGALREPAGCMKRANVGVPARRHAHDAVHQLPTATSVTCASCTGKARRALPRHTPAFGRGWSCGSRSQSRNRWPDPGRAPSRCAAPCHAGTAAPCPCTLGRAHTAPRCWTPPRTRRGNGSRPRARSTAGCRGT